MPKGAQARRELAARLLSQQEALVGTGAVDVIPGARQLLAARTEALLEEGHAGPMVGGIAGGADATEVVEPTAEAPGPQHRVPVQQVLRADLARRGVARRVQRSRADRKSTRLNSSHVSISY